MNKRRDPSPRPTRGRARANAWTSGARGATIPLKTHHTALVVIPPRELWAPIQAIRERHDRQAARWMPHINLLYPFAPPERWGELVPRLVRACATLEPFDITLARFRHFAQPGGQYSLWLDPEPAAALLRLQERLLKTAPGYDELRGFEGGFVPHLSVGQVARRASLEKLLATLQATWQPLTFRVDELSLISRGDPPNDRFKKVDRIRIGTAMRRTGDAAVDPGT